MTRNKQNSIINVRYTFSQIIVLIITGDEIMKKITSLFLAAALLFSAVSPCMNANAVQTGTQSSGAVVSTEASSRFETRQSADGRYIYSILNDGTAMIVGCQNSYHKTTNDEY